MSNAFFEKPILNTPYQMPARHWELDDQGQPTQKIVESRRRASFITPIPKPKKRKGAARQEEMNLDEGQGISTREQQYDATWMINEVRGYWKLENHKMAGVRHAQSEDRFSFIKLVAWPGSIGCAEVRILARKLHTRAI